MSFLEAGIPNPPEIFEPADALRRRFARGGSIERSLRGDYVCCLQDRGPLKSEGSRAGMRGHMVGYRDTATGLPAFIVHFYMDRDGNIGASGLLDPKWLYEDGVTYTSNLRREPSRAA